MPRSTPKHRLEALKDKQKKIIAQIQQVEAREKTATRKKDTRRKILIGSYYLEKTTDQNKIAEIEKLMDGYLKRDNDRLLFGLSPLGKNEKQV